MTCVRIIKITDDAVRILWASTDSASSGNGPTVANNIRGTRSRLIVIVSGAITAVTVFVDNSVVGSRTLASVVRIQRTVSA